MTTPMALLNKNPVLNLDEFNASTFINFIYEIYAHESSTDISIRFTGNFDFYVKIFRQMMIFEVQKEHQSMVKFLQNQYFPMFVFTTKRARFAYLHFARLQAADFKLVQDMWKLQGDIKQIEIDSHNITFKRYTPMNLQRLCLFLVSKNSSKNLPNHVLERLNIIRSTHGINTLSM